MVTTLFIQRQHNYVQNEVMTQDFPEYLMTSGAFLPISTELPSGAQTYTYKLLTYVGSAAILANGADDIPLVNAYAEERMGRIRTIVDSYEYTVEDLEAAEFNNTNLDTQMAVAARQIMEAKFDQLAYDGDSNFNLDGLLTNPNIPTYTIANDGTGSTTTWSTKTADQVYRDLRNFASATRTATNGVEIPEAIAMPQAQFDLIAGTPYPSASAASETILSFFLKTQRMSPTGVQSVFPAPYLAGKGAGGTDLMISFRKRPDKIKLHMPMDFTPEPVQPRNFSFRVPCRMKTGGTQIYKPYSLRIATGI